MWILNGLIFLALVLCTQLTHVHAQNVCDAAAVARCGPYDCVQIDLVASCLCPNFQLAPTAAGCNAVTSPPVVIPSICGTITCPVGATCVLTNQAPARYICVCPNNIIANPDCPTTPLPNNPCLLSNPCTNGGTCVVNPLTLQAICICPLNTYGANCASYCPRTCNYNWCYNGGRCANAYGTAYCSCPTNYRGRRCELRYNQYNYVYLYQSPYYIGKK